MQAWLSWPGVDAPSPAIADLPLLSQAALTLPFLSPLPADFAFLCNGASEDSERGAELRERPRYEYGPGLEDPHYGLPSPDTGPYYNYLESEYGNPDAGFPRREPNSEFRGSPLHHGPGRSPPRYLPSQTGEYWETQRGAFPPSLCPCGLPGGSHPGQDAPGLEQALFLAALSRSWPHQHHLAMYLMSPPWLGGGSPCSDTVLPPFQASTRASRGCRLRSAGSSMAVRMGAACASGRATPATALMASSWT